MLVVHRPDFDALRRELRVDRLAATKYREWFMYPYINQEDLLNNKSLPLLLNARGRHPPSHFAAADIEAMRLGIMSGALEPIFLNRYVIILNGMTENTRDYGSLMVWEDDPDLLDWVNKQKQFQPGEGLLIMEVQARLLTFLVQCCQQILHDIPPFILTSESFPIIPEPQFKPENEINGFKTLGVMAAEAPYRVPAQLDLGRIEALLSAKASAAQDHLWALREDPDYFAKALFEAKEHSQEMLEDLLGNAHPVLECGLQRVLWARVIKHVLEEAYLGVDMFSGLSIQAKELIALHRKYAADIVPSKDLPEEYLVALLRLRHSLREAAKTLLSRLGLTVAASPPLRQFFAREPTTDINRTEVLFIKPASWMNNTEKQLILLLKILCENHIQLELTGTSLIVDELERLLQSDTHAQELTSSYVAWTVGDLSIISQCLNQLSLYQPWARSFRFEHADRADEVKQYYAKQCSSWPQIRNALEAALPETRKSSEAVQLGDPSDGRFTYLIGKRRTKENVEKLRRAESKLDAFWTAIDRVMLNTAGDLDSSAVGNLLAKERILQRTREWVEPEKSQLASSARNNGGEVGIYTVYQPVSSIYSGLSARSLDVVHPKAKVKTRGIPQPTPAKPLLEPNATDRQPALLVDARALKVFRTVFFDPAVTSTPGEVHWNDFLHAMKSVGFTSMKLYGSVWQFQPTNLDVERKIQFHEPHPHGKLPFWAARRYGRRLNRAYGWFGGMFILDRK